MINPLYKKLAQLVVNYSLNIKKGERVIIVSPSIAEELIQAIYVEVIKVGAHPHLEIEIEGIDVLFYKYASEEQLSCLDNVTKLIYKEFDCHIGITESDESERLALLC